MPTPILTSDTRRNFLTHFGFALPFTGLILATGCNKPLSTSTGDNIINIANGVVLAIQGALPIVSLLVAPGVTPAITLAAGFLNLTNEAFAAIITEAETMDSLATQLKNDAATLAKVILDPTVLAQLPVSVTTPSGATVTVSALVTATVNAYNSFITAFVHQVPGASVVQSATNVLNQMQVPAVLPAALVPMKMSSAQQTAMLQMKALVASNRVVMQSYISKQH